MLIFKIRNMLPKLRLKSLSLPDSEEDRTKFKELIKPLLENSEGFKLDSLYQAIDQVSSEMRLYRTHKGFRKMKF